ncbi:MAG: methylcobamide--CoM methyltransferase, partial [Candidatus Methanomethylophilaceae archaeon]|nr:methylcobamide--CoM methyltransferase [Candidatus Methanomethylophilaceae archaeon]
KVDPFTAVDMVGSKTVLVGNVGSVRPLFQGTPAEVVEGVKKSVEAGFDVISSGCGIAVATPDENMKTFSKTVKGE